MPDPEVIRAQTTPQDGALFVTGYQNSKFVVQNHLCFTEELRQKGVIEQGTVRLGTTINIPFEKTCTLLEDVKVEFTPDALTPAGGATYTRYPDYAGLAFIKEVRWSYGANTIQTYDMTHRFCDIQLMTDEKRANEDLLLLGNTSAAQRNTYSADPYALQVKIPTPWECCRSHCPAISALANKLMLSITFANPADVVQTDGTKPATLNLNDFIVNFEQIHFTGKTRQELTGLQDGPNGLNYLYEDTYRLDYDIDANAFKSTGNFVPIELRDVEGPVDKIHFLLRTQSQLDPTNANTAPYEIDTTYLQGLKYQVTSNNLHICDEETQDRDAVRKIQKFWNCKYDTQQGILLWEEFPEMSNTDSGHVSFGNFTNPKFSLSNASLAGAHPALVLTCIVKRKNWYNHQRGVIQKVWR